MSAPKSIDIMNCPTRARGNHLCRCAPKCSRCNLGPHVSLHGPLLDEPVGSPPYDHEYVPDESWQGQKS